MPMKKLLFTILMFCATLFCCALNDNYGGQDIDLVKYGDLGKGNSRSGECIIATYNNSVLTIGFNVSLGQTEIVLENESGGMVYNSFILWKIKLSKTFSLLSFPFIHTSIHPYIKKFVPQIFSGFRYP